MLFLFRPLESLPPIGILNAGPGPRLPRRHVMNTAAVFTNVAQRAIVGDDRFDSRPERRKRIADRLHAPKHLASGDAVGAPAPATRAVIVEQRLEPVEGDGEPCVGGGPCLELFPERAHRAPLLLRKQPEDT